MIYLLVVELRRDFFRFVGSYPGGSASTSGVESRLEGGLVDLEASIYKELRRPSQGRDGKTR